MKNIVERLVALASKLDNDGHSSEADEIEKLAYNITLADESLLRKTLKWLGYDPKSTYTGKESLSEGEREELEGGAKAPVAKMKPGLAIAGRTFTTMKEVLKAAKTGAFNIDDVTSAIIETFAKAGDNETATKIKSALYTQQFALAEKLAIEKGILTA